MAILNEKKFVLILATFAAIVHLIVAILFKYATGFMNKLASYMCFGHEFAIAPQAWGALLIGWIVKIILVSIIAFVFVKVWNYFNKK